MHPIDILVCLRNCHLKVSKKCFGLLPFSQQFSQILKLIFDGSTIATKSSSRILTILLVQTRCCWSGVRGQGSASSLAFAPHHRGPQQSANARGTQVKCFVEGRTDVGLLRRRRVSNAEGHTDDEDRCVLLVVVTSQLLVFWLEIMCSVVWRLLCRSMTRGFCLLQFFLLLLTLLQVRGIFRCSGAFSGCLGNFVGFMFRVELPTDQRLLRSAPCCFPVILQSGMETRNENQMLLLLLLIYLYDA